MKTFAAFAALSALSQVAAFAPPARSTALAPSAQSALVSAPRLAVGLARSGLRALAVTRGEKSRSSWHRVEYYAPDGTPPGA